MKKTRYIPLRIIVTKGVLAIVFENAMSRRAARGSLQLFLAIVSAASCVI
jgi:hypothetical protein